MKNIYYSVLLGIVMCGGFVSTSFAQGVTPVGLDVRTVQMSQLASLKAMYLVPAYAVIANQTAELNAPFLRTEAEEGEQLLGGGVIYGSQIEKLGLQLSYYYFMTAVIALGGDLSFFFPEKVSAFNSTFTQTLFTLNVMGHYIIYATLMFRAYVLAGLNYAIFRFKAEVAGVGSDTSSSSELGLNLGGGIEYALATGFLFLELKYIVSEFDQLVIAFGYRMLLGAR